MLIGFLLTIVVMSCENNNNVIFCWSWIGYQWHSSNSEPWMWKISRKR